MSVPANNWQPQAPKSKKHKKPQSSESKAKPSGDDEVNKDERYTPAATETVVVERPAAASAVEAKAGPWVLDGSLLEGGGQVLRNAIAYSALLHQPIRVQRIRAGRAKDGLRAQHLCGIQLVQDMVNADLENGRIQATDITFAPKFPDKIPEFYFEKDTGTAGSVCLLMQITMPVLLFLPGAARVVLRGGTNAINAPLIDYAQEIFTPVMRKHFKGIDFDIILNKRGFYPRGGGEVELRTRPVKGQLPAINITDRGQIVRIKGLAVTSGRLPDHIRERFIKSATFALRKNGVAESVPIDIQPVKETHARSPSDGCFLIVWAETSTGCLLAASALGEKGVSSEEVGTAVGTELAYELQTGACVDQYLQDQLIIYMALAKGRSAVLAGPLTLHTRTAIHWATFMTGAKFTLTPRDHAVLIECEGVGYSSRFSSS